MYRQLITKLILLSVIVSFIHSQEYDTLYCPNSQIAEVGDNGSVKHCLPGHYHLCGTGYSCYFSGTNYQCCPAEDEIQHPILECPSPSITILTDAGLPFTCTPGILDCPESSMQCLTVGQHSICCEGLTTITDTSHDAFSLNLLNFPKEISKPIALNNELISAPNLECPEPAFTILDGNGDPVPCSKDDCTHQRGRFCYKTQNTAICCEGEESSSDETRITKTMREDMHKKERNFGWSVLKYRPLTTAQHQQGLNELAQKNSSLRLDGTDFVRSTTFDQITSQINANARRPGEKQITTRFENSNESIGSDNMKGSLTITTASAMSGTTETTVITSTKSESQLFKKPKDEIETVRYKPHSAGGYAVSKAFSSKTSRAPNDLRALARKYLLEQIKRGWPYSDEFYRSDSTFEPQTDSDGEIIFPDRT